MIIHKFCLFLLLSSSVFAQEAAPEKAKVKGLQLQLLSGVPISADFGEVFLAFEETRSDAVELSANQLSKPISVLSREMVLKFEKNEKELCKIKLPESGKAFAVVLVPGQKATYETIIVRTDDPNFKAGDMIFINRSGETIFSKLGEKMLVLKSGQVEKTRPSGAVKNTYYNMLFATRKGKDYKTVRSFRRPINNQIRSYMFFFRSRAGNVIFRAVNEYLPVKIKK